MCGCCADARWCGLRLPPGRKPVQSSSCAAIHHAQDLHQARRTSRSSHGPRDVTRRMPSGRTVFSWNRPSSRRTSAASDSPRPTWSGEEAIRSGAQARIAQRLHRTARAACSDVALKEDATLFTTVIAPVDELRIGAHTIESHVAVPRDAGHAEAGLGPNPLSREFLCPHELLDEPVQAASLRPRVHRKRNEGPSVRNDARGCVVQSREEEVGQLIVREVRTRTGTNGVVRRRPCLRAAVTRSRTPTPSSCRPIHLSLELS